MVSWTSIRTSRPPRATGFDAFAGIDVPKGAPQRKAAKPKPDPRIRELEQRLRTAERAAGRAEQIAREARAEADALAAELRELRG